MEIGRRHDVEFEYAYKLSELGGEGDSFGQLRLGRFHASLPSGVDLENYY